MLSATETGRLENDPIPDDFTQSVLAHLEILTSGLSSESASELHEHTLRRFDKKWQEVFCDVSCLICLSRVPQYKLPCGHSICEPCVLIFGHSCLADPWLATFELCPLCQNKAEFSVRVRPPTAGNSILCIDGGGIRGIVPLMTLVSIQGHLGLPIPVQELFSLCYGTSVGKSNIWVLHNIKADHNRARGFSALAHLSERVVLGTMSIRIRKTCTKRLRPISIIRAVKLCLVPLHGCFVLLAKSRHRDEAGFWHK